MLFLRYEDMKMDPKEAIRKTANYLGKGDLSDQVIDRIVEATSFDSMKKDKSVNYEWVPFDKSLPGHIRKGVVGDWKNHFQDEQLVRDFDEYIHKNLPQELIFETSD